jgi:superoxide dismutase, Cu-Zn family
MSRLARTALAGIVSVAAVAVGSLAVGSPAAAAKPVARASLSDASGARVGEVVFKGFGRHVVRATITIEAPGAPGLGDFHGLHIHTVGSCVAPAFTSAGGHWNPTSEAHGQHTGDLPSVLLSTTGRAFLEVETPRFDVDDLFDADGSAVVLHVGRDNFANIPADPYGGAVGATLTTGDAGGRFACGVVTR